MQNQAPKAGFGHVQSVGRALQLVELLASEGRGMPLTEIAKAMGWPKSTVHGLLASLREHHYVEQMPATGHYCLGVRLFELGNIVARGWNIRDTALPVMQRLNAQLGEMVQLATEDKGEVLYIDKVDASHMLRIVSEIGSRLPMHCTGLGKLLLAYKTPAEVKWILARRGMQRMTARTITTREQLTKELALIRRQGYAVDDREIMDGLRCVAAPVWNRENQVQYGVSISGAANRLEGERLAACITAVQGAAEEISRHMGYRGGNM